MSGTGKIAALAKKLEGIASPEFRQGLLEALSTGVHQLVLDGFIQQRDPEGKAWAPRKSGGSWPILDTRRGGGAVKGITVRPSSQGVTVRTSDYMRYHLYGTATMPARRWIPTKELGPIWRPALMSVYSRQITGLLK